jgi:hypothetical protein
MQTYNAFALRWASEIPIWDFALAAPADAFDVSVRRGPEPAEPTQPDIRRTISPTGVRFTYQREPVLEVTREAIEILAGRDWSGMLPARFFGSATACVLALNGLVPLHASAVAVDGDGILICGGPGAGKSTLAAACVARGADLISDDLSAVRFDGKTCWLVPGRRSIRLHPRAANLLGDSENLGPARDGKSHRAPAKTTLQAVPLRRIVVLRDRPVEADPLGGLRLMMAQQFRPKMMRGLTDAKARMQALTAAASTPIVVTSPPAQGDIRHYLDEAGRLISA